MPQPADPSSERAVVEEYLDAHARADVAAAAALFTTDAVVVDDGGTHRGRTEVVAWLEQTSTAWTYSAVSTTSLARRDGQWVVDRHLEGDFPGGAVDLAYAFVVSEGAVAALTIRPA